METFAAVLILILTNGWDHRTNVTPIYFASMEACESAMPAIVEQVKEIGKHDVSAKCYEEAANHVPN